MKKIIALSVINCMLILLTVVIHKIIYRVMLLGYDNLVTYWGLFILVFLVLNLLVNIMFYKEQNNL
ncbi:bacteriocin-like WGxF protein [Lysinibacillus xylanilyticus]|uniref:bacteriocin-like WGxF protein n=1 Tax=Lysinibacillus xylanilyticus TaxID=582475 RepID=UPI002B245B7B|nr:bacteriocin-like WGxF protein [Lysinibacillus xylanilyticus]MEB2301779.1 bacteriocin-like WGxF protein [Lysinibacillus xylanilyticus]